MQSHWLIRKGNDSLIIFALGWAADHRIVEHIAPEGYDVLCIYDYRDFDRQPISLPKYERTYLLAWSFGVWAAEHLFAGSSFTKTIALNGTPRPIDTLYGIEPRRLAITIKGLSSGGMEPFDRRAYGSSYEALEPLLSPRSLSENVAELTTLQELASVTYTPTTQWDMAIIGSDDSIFPPENMLRYWGKRSEIVPLAHYPFADKQLILERIEREECR